MTFSVIKVENDRPRVVGTIWAHQEAEAKALASNLFKSNERDSVSVRQTEGREMPLNLAE